MSATPNRPSDDVNGFCMSLHRCTWSDSSAVRHESRYIGFICTLPNTASIRHFLDLLRSGYEIREIDLTHCSTIPRISRRKRGSTGYDGYKKVKGSKLSALVDRNGLLSPAPLHRQISTIPTLRANVGAFRFQRCKFILKLSADAALRARRPPVQPETKDQEQYPDQRIPDTSEAGRPLSGSSDTVYRRGY